MKKLLILCTLCLSAVTFASAQQLEKGSGLINVGVGFVPGIGANVSYDHGIIDTWGPGTFTVGGFAGFNVWTDDVLNASYTDYSTTEFAVGPRATYRYGINETFEVYATAMFGVSFLSYSNNYKNSATDFAAGATAGCRYSFSKNISVFAELGYNGVSCVNGGLSFHL